MYIVVEHGQKELYGILTGQEHKLFVQQRDMNLYECIKIKKSEVKVMLQKLAIDEDEFAPITREKDSLIVFPHEELYVLESLDTVAMEVHHSYRNMVKHISTFLKFDKDELDIMGEYFNIFEKVVTNMSWEVDIDLSYQDLDDQDVVFYGPFDSTYIFTDALKYFGLKTEKGK